MPLWPWPLTFESCHVMSLGWSIPVPRLNWMRLTVPELGQLQCSIDCQLKVPIFTFFGEQGGQISNFIFQTPKGTTLARTTYNDVLCVGVCPEMRLVAVAKRPKKTELSCIKLPDHPRRHSPLKFCMRGRVRELVIYFKFHGNRSRGLGAVEGRKSPSPIDKAHGLYNSLYYRTSRDYTACLRKNVTNWILNNFSELEPISIIFCT